MLARDDSGEIAAYVAAASRPESPNPGWRVRSARDRIDAEVRRQMTVHVLREAILRSTTGVQEGRIRFNLANGFLAQKLLFKRDLERKPVSLCLFRLMWPFLTQRKFLMPLVQPRGIWCFYSKSLITRLASIVGDRQCLEIAAGDGTLSNFLAIEGVNIVATDNYSWSENISFPESVLKQDARSALREHQPEVVICSWPPAGNDFERHVFATPSVQAYIVISSGSELSTGSWAAYRSQDAFEFAHDLELSRLVLPPEVDHAVYIFTRRP